MPPVLTYFADHYRSGLRHPDADRHDASARSASSSSLLFGPETKGKVLVADLVIA